MKTATWIGMTAGLGLALAAGWWLGRATAPAPETLTSVNGAPERTERKVLFYRNPMGLPDTSPVPKKDSMGMDYIPVYDGEEPTEPGTVVLPPEKVQKLGVRTQRATREQLATQVRASATVQVDETRQFVVAPRFEGWIETLHANQTGMRVRRGQTLMTLYSPELLAAHEEFRIADVAAEQLAESDPASAAAMRKLRDAATARLRNWNVAGSRQSGSTESARLAITAPADAVVIEKPVVAGDRFEAGQTVLRLADLSQVWVVAQVPTSQAAQLAVGDEASFETPSLVGERYSGRIDFIHPVVDVDSRTVDVRIVLANPEGRLRPGLFGDAQLRGAPDQATLVVPRSAVIDSGTRQIVLVQMAEGRFEPRAVRLGRRNEDRVAVLEGIEEGEQVVVAANFLIDAESNLKSALQGLSDAAEAPSQHQHDAAARPAQEPAPDSRGAALAGDRPASADPHANHGGAAPAEETDHSGHDGEH